MKKHFVSAMVISALLSVSAHAGGNNQLWPWAVYYSDKAPISSFAPYKLLVLDSTYHPPLAPLHEQKKMLLGYISLGEVEQHRPWFNKAKAAGIVLQENENWKGSYFVDMRSKAWKKIVLEDILPTLDAKGFDGFFYDTLDNPAHLEDSNPQLYAGMKAAAVELLHTIRTKYPDKKLMMNRGYGLLPEAAPHLDMLLAESFYTDYDFTKKTYRKVPSADYKAQLQMIETAKKANPKIGLYTLDYWKPEDKTKVQHIYAVQQQSGFSPYVSTLALDTLFAPPSAP